MTTLPVLWVVNNDKRDTLSSILQVGLPALKECIEKKFNWKRVLAVYSRTWLCNTSTAGSWNAPGTAACAPSHKHYSSFPEGSEVSFLDLHGSIIASIWQDLAVDKDEWKQTGKGENTPRASAPPSASLLSPDQSYSFIWFPTLKLEPHNNKQATGSQSRPLLSQPLSFTQTAASQDWASLCIFCSFFLGHCRAENKHKAQAAELGSSISKLHTFMPHRCARRSLMNCLCKHCLKSFLAANSSWYTYKPFPFTGTQTDTQVARARQGQQIDHKW